MSISAFQGLRLSATDIKGAYLNAKLKSVVVHMRLQPQVVTILLELYKDLFGRDITEYIEPDGSLIVQVLKALYGLKESALLWYEHLVSTLSTIGYSVSKHDRGVLFKRLEDSGEYSFICIHVDDLLQSTNSKALEDELQQTLAKVYKEINTQLDTTQLFYLGMQLDINRERVAAFQLASLDLSKKSY